MDIKILYYITLYTYSHYEEPPRDIDDIIIYDIMIRRRRDACAVVARAPILFGYYEIYRRAHTSPSLVMRELFR